MSNIQRARSEILEWLSAFAQLFRPIDPRSWPRYAWALSRAPGWMPTAFVTAYLAVTFIAYLVIEGLVGGDFARFFGVFTFLTWSMISMIALLIGCFESARNVRRLGPRFLMRTRIWFELSRFSFHSVAVIAIAFVAWTAITGILNVPAPALIGFVTFSRFVTFLAIFGVSCGAIGLLLLILRLQRAPGSRAFDCVSFYLLCGGGMLLLTWCYDRLLNVPFWPNGVLFSLLGLVGLAIALIGGTVLALRHKQWERRWSGRSASAG